MSIKNRKSKVKNRSPIYDQNGAEMAKIDTLFMMAEKSYPLGSHIPIDRQTDRPTDRQADRLTDRQTDMFIWSLIQ